MSSERTDRLEERLAWLERHVTEQDKVMLAQGDALARLRRELALLRARHEDDGLPRRPPATRTTARRIIEAGADEPLATKSTKGHKKKAEGGGAGQMPSCPPLVLE